MKKILLLTDFYYPNPSANGICIEKIADSLMKKGHKVYIVAFGIGKEKKHETIKGAEIYRVKAPLFYQARENNKGKGLSKFLFTICRIFRYMSIVVFLYKYPLIHPLFANKYAACVKKIARKEHIDRIIAEYVPIEAVYAGIKAKEANKEMALNVYVVDTFTQCPNALNNNIIRTVSQKWEKKIIEKSDKFYYIDNYSDYYSKQEFAGYSNKMHAVGLPLIQNNYIEKNSDNIYLTFLYTGAWGGERNPEKILEALNKINGNKNIRFLYCGKPNLTIYEMQKKYEFVSFEGFKNQDELRDIYKITDILVNIGNSTNMLPSKMFAYMSTGLPILHFYINESDPCISLLNRYGGAENIDLEKVSADNIMNAIDKIKNIRVKYCEIERNFSNYVPDNIANEMLGNWIWIVTYPYKIFSSLDRTTFWKHCGIYLKLDHNIPWHL